MKFTQSNVRSLRPPAGKTDHTEWDDALPKFGIRFRNGGPGTYIIQFYLNGKEAKMALGKVAQVTLDAARTEARQQFAKIAKKIDPHVERAKAVSQAGDTFEASIDDFLAYLGTSTKRNGKKRSPSYLTENERSLRRYFKTLHRFAVADIDRGMVAKELAKVRTERGPIAADRSRAHLSKFFGWLIMEGRATLNPVSGTAKTGNAARDRVLTDKELKAIWKQLGDDDHGKICKLLILTGQRREEIGSLSRCEINLDQKQVELPGSRTKNGLDHVVPLSPFALSILKSREPRASSEFVFGRGEGGFSGWSNCKERLDAKLDVEPWVLHDFRRTLSTVMHERLKVPPHIVEAVLNHISGARAGVAGTYNRALYLDEKREALKKYAAHIEGLINPKPQLSVVQS